MLRLSLVQKVKTGIHAVASLSIFIAACIQIAVLARGSPDGRSQFYFAVCFLSIPALVYLIAAPIWPRASGVARTSWFLAVDVSCTFFWLVAFASVLAWNNSGVKEGAKEAKKADSDASCATFAHGSEAVCKLSYAVSGFGIWIFFLFLITSAISVFYLVKSKRNSQAGQPWLAADADSSKYAPAMGDMSSSFGKDPAWDPSITAHEDADDVQHRPYSAPHADEEHLQPSNEGLHSSRPVHWGPLAEPQGHGAAATANHADTEYRGAAAYVQPSATMMPPYPTYPSQPLIGRPANGQDPYASHGGSAGRHGRFPYSAELR